MGDTYRFLVYPNDQGVNAFVCWPLDTKTSPGFGKSQDHAVKMAIDLLLQDPHPAGPNERADQLEGFLEDCETPTMRHLTIPPRLKAEIYIAKDHNLGEHIGTMLGTR